MTKERILDTLYLGHAIIIWGGCLWQIIHTYNTRSAEDIALAWIAALFIAHIIAIPRAACSHYGVWKLCRIVSAFLMAVLFVGVIIYG